MAVDWTMPPADREEMVVEPLAATVKYDWLDEEATVKMGRVGLVEDPSTTKLAVGVEELTPTW